jgi:HD-GYP domain-containing protein (c-di-GMP phosphodiesterase class II)
MAPRTDPTAAGGARRAEVLAALSLAIDLGLGQPMEHMLRGALIAGRLADRLGLDEHRRGVVYYVNLTAWIGCHADSHELADLFGDDIAYRSDSYGVDWKGLPFLALLATHAGRDRPSLARAARVAALLAGPRGKLRKLISSHCASAGVLAQEAGLGPEVGNVLTYAFERWDGGGLPRGASGTEIPVEMRVVHVAETVEVHLRRSGLAAALAMVRTRRGTQFDPEVVAAFEDCATEIVEELAGADAWQAALDQAPDGDRILSAEELDTLLAAVGAFADLKCPYMTGHSAGVAELAASAARHHGLPDADVRVLRRAGLVHDLGRMGVSNGVWEKRTGLSDGDWERVRLYPYLTGRILSKVTGLQDVASVASAHHERLDGSGYPRGLAGASLSASQRLLAAADMYYALREDRPYRPALNATDAADAIRREAREARLDADAVAAVLAAAGQPERRRRAWPGGVTAREVEVLRLVAQGHTTSAIAARLHITEKTVRNHIEHVFAKIGVNNRTGASLYALRHGLLGDVIAVGASKGSADGAAAPGA